MTKSLSQYHKENNQHQVVDKDNDLACEERMKKASIE